MSGVFYRIALQAVERGWTPDWLTRAGIRRLCRERLAEEGRRSAAGPARELARFAEEMHRGPIAPVPEKANEQHYELPAEFFELVLGPRLKYSSCYWPEDCKSLAEAEEASLEAACERAGLADGMRILELGCGWGSLSLWMAEKYPNARITAVSNSAPQRRLIEARAARQGLSNLRVITADMNEFDTAERFDRAVSVEMFEHMRNYERLLARIAEWLDPHGKLFVHIFCHRRYAYAYGGGPNNWMGEYFFTGGIMPSEDLLARFSRDLAVTGSWRWHGLHYQRTAEAWLANLDAHREQALAILERIHGTDAQRWFVRWRLFFLACSEMFGLDGGEEWGVGHYLLEPVAAGSKPAGRNGGATASTARHSRTGSRVEA